MYICIVYTENSLLENIQESHYWLKLVTPTMIATMIKK